MFREALAFIVFILIGMYLSAPELSGKILAKSYYKFKVEFDNEMSRLAEQTDDQ